MLIDFSKYKFEVLIVTAIFLVILVPYLLIATSLFGYVTSETKLKEIETITQQLTPLVIGLLCALLVYHSIKKKIKKTSNHKYATLFYQTSIC